MKTLFTLALIAAVSTLGFASDAKKDPKKAEACKTECAKGDKAKACTHDKTKKDAKCCSDEKKADAKKDGKCCSEEKKAAK